MVVHFGSTNALLGNGCRSYLRPLELHLLAQLLQLVLLHLAPSNADQHGRLDAFVADARIASRQLAVLLRRQIANLVHDLLHDLPQWFFDCGRHQRTLDHRHSACPIRPAGRRNVQRYDVRAHRNGDGIIVVYGRVHQSEAEWICDAGRVCGGDILHGERGQAPR